MDKLIRLITTDGCQACKIIEPIIEKAMSLADISDVRLEVIDCLDLYYFNFIKDNKITDFPSIVFMIGDKVEDIYVGTKPVYILEKKIKSIFS